MLVCSFCLYSVAIVLKYSIKTINIYEKKNNQDMHKKLLNFKFRLQETYLYRKR